MLKIIEHPELLALIVMVVRVAYSAVSHLVKPYPRWRAAVEALAALGPDGLRFTQKAMEAAYGRPMVTLDRRAPDPEKEALLRRLEAAEKVIDAMRETGK